MIPEHLPQDTAASPEDLLGGLLLTLPPAWPPDVREVRQVGTILYTPAVIPRWGAQVRYQGAVDADLPVATAARAARLCVHNLVAVVRKELGSLDRVAQVMQISVLVRCSDNFENLSRVADGASEALVQLFGPAGRHRRNVAATQHLPEDASVQVSGVIRFS